MIVVGWEKPLAGATCVIKNVLHNVHFCPCRRILVVSFLASAPFWPFLVERRGVTSFVLDFRVVENGKDVYLNGVNNCTLFGSENFSTPLFFSFA